MKYNNICNEALHSNKKFLADKAAHAILRPLPLQVFHDATSAESLGYLFNQVTLALQLRESEV